MTTPLGEYRRQVSQHCIYGVDRDPFSVELAKCTLWVNAGAGDPDRPLVFLDHKIVCGDSLVGWPLHDQMSYIPDGAYNPPKDLKGKQNAPARQRYRDARDTNRKFLAQYNIDPRDREHPHSLNPDDRKKPEQDG